MISLLSFLGLITLCLMVPLLKIGLAEESLVHKIWIFIFSLIIIPGVGWSLYTIVGSPHF